MNQSPRVSVSYEQLVEVFAALLAHVRSVSPGETVEIYSDYFWSVPVSEMGDVYSDPPQLTIGQNSESWSNLESMVGNGSIVSHGLVWFADILRAISKDIPG